MDTIGDWLSLALGVLGIVTLLAATLAVFRGQATRVSLDLLRGSVTDLTSDNGRLREKLANLTSENVKLRDEVAVLRDLVTSRAAVEQLTKEIASLATIVRDDHQTILSALARTAPAN